MTELQYNQGIFSKENRDLEKVLVALLQTGDYTRPQMVQKTGVPRTTIYDSLKRLIKADIVYRYPLRDGIRRKGRPKVLFSLVRT